MLKTPVLALLISSLLLSACSQGSKLVPMHSAYHPAYVVQVAAPASQTAADLEARYGGKVLSLIPSAGQALLGFDSDPSRRLQTQDLGDLSSETNLDAFSAGASATMNGRVSMWMGGRVSMWMGGRVSMWMGGQYQPVVENTAPFQQISLQAAQTKAPKLGQGIKVAVIDTGIDLSHPAFEGALAPQSEWYDFVDNDKDPSEPLSMLGEGGYGHGTAVAGIVLEVAPGATILPLRVLGSDGSGDVASVATAIYYAVSKGAKIINLSLGSADRSQIVQDAVTWANTAGVLVVSSGGNDNREGLTYPAQDMQGKGAERSVGVGSVDAGDLKSSFSNYGRALGVVAPGENIYAPGPGATLVSWSGTSMAAPITTGALALALAEKPTYSTKDLLSKLIDKADTVYAQGMNSAYKDKLGRKGRLDITSFVNEIVGN